MNSTDGAFTPMPLTWRTLVPQAPASTPGSWAHGVVWMLVGQSVLAASHGLLLVAMAKLGDERMVGQFALALAVTTPIVILARLGLRGVQGTDVVHEYRFGSYLTLRLITMVCAFVLIGALSYWGHFDQTTAIVILILGLVKIAESVGDVYYGLFQQRHRLDLVGRSMALKGATSLPLFVLTLGLWRDVVWATGALLSAWILWLLVFDRPEGRRLLGSDPHQDGLDWDLSALTSLAVLSLPLGAHMMLSAVQAHLPRYYLQEVGLAEVGVFSALAYIVAASTQLVNAAGAVATPRLAAEWHAGNRRGFHRMLLGLVGVAAALGVALVSFASLLGRDALGWVYTAAYAQHVDVFILLAASGGIAYVSSLLGNALTAARQLRLQLVVMLAGTAATAIGCAYLTRPHGLRGAGVAVLAGSLVQLTGLGIGVAATLRRWRSCS